MQLLGPVRASNSAGSIALRGKTARTVLAQLALASGSVVSVDRLAEGLWDEDPPLEPLVSLRSIVSRLRSQLGHAAIITDGAGYRLDATLIDIDLAQVEAAMRTTDLASLDPADLAAFLDLWSGEALADVASTLAFEPERVRIAELRARLIDCYHEAMLRAGRAPETLADLERDAAAAPLREATQLLLMRALDASSRTADALRAGDDYRNRLIDQTGLSPTHGYDAVARSLLNEDVEGETSAGDQSVSRRQSPPRAWIPPDTPFVGRETEMARLEQLTLDRRLVTITGPGGAGKTRLATEFFRSNGGRSHGEVNMVSLSAVHRSTGVDAAVATALGLETSAADALAALVERFSSTESILVLDNCEHVLASTRLLAEHLLQHVSDLRIVTTSRRRLGLPDEALVEVGALDVPIRSAANSPPIQLFIDRVERAAPRLLISEQDLLVAVDICRLLDGLPLALEVAAARVPMFGFDGLRRRLLDGLALPSSYVADDDRRQATIESTVEWSLALLEPDARELFDDLTVFPSWFDLAALAYVSDAENILDAFSEIMDSSLVVIDHQRPAYRLLEPIRQVVHRQLKDDRRERSIDRFLAWTTDLVQQVDGCWLDAPGDEDLALRQGRRVAAQQLIADHRHDLRRALTHLADRKNAETHGHFALVLARALIERSDIELIELCRIDVGPSVEGELGRCILAWHQGDPETSVAIADRLESMIDASSPYWPHLHWAVAPAQAYLGNVAAVARSAQIAATGLNDHSSMRSASIAVWALAVLYQGRPDDANAVLEEHSAILSHSSSGGLVIFVRAEIEAVTDLEAAMELLDLAASDATATESSFVQRMVEVSRLAVLIRLGRLDEAIATASRLLPRLLRAGILPQAWLALRHVADLLGQLGEPDLAIFLLDSADTDDSAAAIGSQAVRAEASRRTSLVEHPDRRGDAGLEPMPAGRAWDAVAPILQRHPRADPVRVLG